jgi:tetratricopeptide (TPR) repeat protein
MNQRFKKQKIILIGVVIAGLVIAGGIFYWKNKQEKPPPLNLHQQSLELTQQAEEAINNKEYEKCEKLAQQAVDLDQNNIEAHILLGRSRYAQKKLEQARDAYLSGLEKDPRNLTMHFFVANVFRDLREFDLSKEHYKAALEIDSHHTLLWHNYAASYALDQEDWEGAVRVYEEALKINPDDEFLQRQYEIAKENTQEE